MGSLENQIVTFEYNESHGIFHDNIGECTENTVGYRTVCKTTYPIWDEFRKLVDMQYKVLAGEEGDQYLVWKNNAKPSYSDIVSLWNIFTKSKDL